MTSHPAIAGSPRCCEKSFGVRRMALQRQMALIRRTVERLLVRGSLMGMCRELYKHRSWIWAFVRQDHVEPTGNASERAYGTR